ncbi:lipid-binding transfer protein [Babesia ovata]|uniref:Lipid-binding transfer protein n=1 Tax=Babesia ovata TaxID=189622 RepID=A0A2H6KEZ1_9APIC|nr:lipid-binding transfer protein [Babesia ovata]GBE61561.1 lipid-binding transfer protein [Babesia ovata]
MVDEMNNNAPSDPCSTEPLSPELSYLVGCLKNGIPFEGWNYVRDFEANNNTLHISSRCRGSGTLKEFLVHGDIDVSKEKLVELILTMNQRSEWDETYVEHKIIRPSENATDIVYTVSKYPFPLSKRVYTIKRSLYGSMDDVVVLATKVIPYDYPLSSRWITRVDDFESNLIVSDIKDKPDHCRMIATLYEDPRVILPNMYLNLIIESLVPRILNKMFAAAKQYGSDKSTEFCRQLFCVPLDYKGESPSATEDSA